MPRAALLVLLLAFAARAQDDGVTVYLTKEEALAHVFPGATRVVELRHLLDREQSVEVERLARAELEEGGFYVYAAWGAAADPIGYAVVVAQVGKVKPITHIVGVTPQGAVGRVAVMIYRETHGAEVAAERFMAQYAGKTLADPIRIDKDVINIAGATLSGHAICRGVRKALAVVQVVLLAGTPEQRAGLLATGTEVTPAGAPPADAPSDSVRAERRVMGSLCTIQAWSTTAGVLQAALDEIERWDAVLSDWRADSALSRLNAQPAGEPLALHEDLSAFLLDARGWWQATDGAFDPGVGALVDAWGMRTQAPACPADLSALLAASGLRLLDLEQGSATRLHPGLRLDPGASGKGWALDRAADLLRARGITRALLSFRSSLVALGAFTVPIVHDLDGSVVTVLELADGSLSVSSGGASAFEQDGVLLGHTLDPRTGEALPAARLAFVRHASASASDALATALQVAGPALAPVAGASGGFVAAPGEAVVAWPALGQVAATR